MSFPLVKVEEFCRTGSGATPARDNPDYYGGSIPWIKSGELRETLIAKSEEFVTEHALQKTALKLIPPGAVLIAMYGATVGRVGLLGIEATTNQAVCHIIPDAQVADTRYLYYFMQSQAGEFIRRGVGGAQPNISQGMIRETLVPLPPLDEQKRIAAILDQADALRGLRFRALDHLNALGQAIFHEMFETGSVPTEPLSKVVRDVRIGPFGSLLHKSDYVEGGTPLINPMHIRDGKIYADKNFAVSDEKATELDRYRIKVGQIILGRRGEMGRSAVVRDEQEGFICGTGSMILTPDSRIMGAEFLSFYLRTPQARKRLEQAASGVTMANLNSSSLDDVLIPVPTPEMQAAFAGRLLASEDMLAISEHNMEIINDLFASLRHRAFRGEL